MKNTFLLIGAPLIIVGAFAGFIGWNTYHSAMDTTGMQYVTPETFSEWYTQGKAL